MPQPARLQEAYHSLIRLLPPLLSDQAWLLYANMQQRPPPFLKRLPGQLAQAVAALEQEFQQVMRQLQASSNVAGPEAASSTSPAQCAVSPVLPAEGTLQLMQATAGMGMIRCMPCSACLGGGRKCVHCCAGMIAWSAVYCARRCSTCRQPPA
jgi:hypothetical protein